MQNSNDTILNLVYAFSYWSKRFMNCGAEDYIQTSKNFDDILNTFSYLRLDDIVSIE